MLITLDEMIVHRIFMIVIAKYHVKATRRVLADLPPPPHPPPPQDLDPQTQSSGGRGGGQIVCVTSIKFFPYAFCRLNIVIYGELSFQFKLSLEVIKCYNPFGCCSNLL